MRGRLPPGRAPGKENTVNVHLNGDAWLTVLLALTGLVLIISKARKGPRE